MEIEKIDETELECEKTYLVELKPCSNRVGRVYDGKAVICCGYRVVTGSECITCKVHDNKDC